MNTLQIAPLPLRLTACSRLRRFGLSARRSLTAAGGSMASRPGRRFGRGLGWVDLHQNQAALDRYPLGSWSNALMEERWAWTRSAGSRSSSICGDMVWTISTPENRDVPVVLIYQGERMPCRFQLFSAGMD